jgi:hypothetical protein
MYDVYRYYQSYKYYIYSIYHLLIFKMPAQRHGTYQVNLGLQEGGIECWPCCSGTGACLGQPRVIEPVAVAGLKISSQAIFDAIMPC